MTTAGNPVLNGEIDYGRVFITFTKHTDSKIAHGLILEALLRALLQRGVLLRDGRPTALVDLGCGEGHTACEMIDAINRVHPRGDGVNYYGLDADQRFVLATDRLLNAVKDSKQLRVIDVRQADVLDGKPLPIVSMDHVLATLGHVLYYAHSREGRDQTRKNIAAIVDSLGRHLHRVSDYQLMLSRKQSPELKEHVELAVLQVEQSLDRIRREAEDAFNQKAGV
jgi:SAM-dependent methyltransferase